MSEFLTTILFWGAIAFVVGAIAFVYFTRVMRLSNEEALRRAIKIGYQIWEASDFTAPAELAKPQVAGKLLREAGLVLKAEIVGNSTYGFKLTQDAAKPHPELSAVDPLELAMGVQSVILGGRR